jgi:hypothetical protein
MTSSGLKHDREIARQQRRAEKAKRRSERRNGNAPEAGPADPDPQPNPQPVKLTPAPPAVTEVGRLVEWRQGRHR